MKLSKLYIFHILATLFLLVWSGGCGCSDEQINNLDEYLDASDIDTINNTKAIKTKVANKQFTLSLLLDPSVIDDGVTINGSASYYIYNNNTNSFLATGTEISYDSGNTLSFFGVTNNSGLQITQKQFTISKAYKNLQIRAYTYVADVNTNTKVATTISCNPTIINVSSGGCGNTECSKSDSTQKNCYREQISTDNFAVRPNNFTMSSASNLNSVTSAQDVDLTFTAADYSGIQTTGYTTNPTLEISTTYYDKNNAVNPSGMTGTSTIITQPSFTDGLALNAKVKFDNVGKVGMHFIDKTWATVDSGDTPQNCSATGGWLCGDVNTTHNPASFTFETKTIKHAHNGTYTYFANDLDKNMSALMDIKISARNAANVITTNFTQNLWDKPMKIELTSTTAHAPTFVKQDINTSTLLGYTNGSKIIHWDESNTSKQLKFNFARDEAKPLNPLEVAIGDIRLNATATYPTGDVTGTATNTNAIHFLYGRTHAPRQRFKGANGNAFIYFEVYCNGVDDNNVTCHKAKLPNGASSKFTDDPRWFVNKQHTLTAGEVGTVSQQGTSKTNIGTIVASTGKTTVPISYTGSAYPYKATMENNASKWLIYDKYSKTSTPTTKNEFIVEFTKSTSSWAGAGENDASTSGAGAAKTNRRTMW